MLLCAQCHVETPDHSTCRSCGESPMLNERYRVVRIVGEGAQGVSFLGYRDGDDRPLAIKEFVLSRASSWKGVEQFEREAIALAGIDHPSVPKFVESFWVESGRAVLLYVVREFVQGRDLRSLGKLTRERAFELGAKLLEILADLHEQAVPLVHRDIKPANVIMRDDAELAIVDFGSVRKDQSVGSTIAGTFGYMAPEQLAGIATPASDVYAVGATIASLLTGRDASDLMQGQTLHLSQLRVGQFAPVLNAMVSTDPQKRPSARTAAAEIRSVLARRAKGATVPRTTSTALTRVTPARDSLQEIASSEENYEIYFFLNLVTAVMCICWISLVFESALAVGGVLLAFSVFGLALRRRAAQAREFRLAIANGLQTVGRVTDTTLLRSSDSAASIRYQYEFHVCRDAARRPQRYVGSFDSTHLGPLRTNAEPVIAYAKDDPRTNALVGWRHGSAVLAHLNRPYRGYLASM